MTVVSFSLFSFPTLSARLWALGQMGLAPRRIAAIPDIAFFKLMGTGAGAGFSTWPNFGVYTLLAQWPSVEVARARLAEARVLQGYRRRTDRTATLYLEATSTRGSWAGHSFAPGAEAAAQRLPLVALTRASIRPSKLPRFWARVPAISRTAEAETARHFMIGTGEIPWLHQVTVSLWDSADAMERFSRDSPTHGEAVRAAYRDGWFSEYCFTRFNLLAVDGQWPGLGASDTASAVPQPPLETLRDSADAARTDDALSSGDAHLHAGKPQPDRTRPGGARGQAT